MRLPNEAHEMHAHVLKEIAPDFKLLDAWALPVEGDRDTLETFLTGLTGIDPARAGSSLSRFLFWVRLRLGELFGWDDPTKTRPIPGCTETTLADRLPDELRGSADDVTLSGAMGRIAGGFVPLYRTRSEWAAEISNDTVHGVMHLAAVEQPDGRYRVQMGVYVKPRGRKGEIYMLLIQPFRHLIVYPALMRFIRREWQARSYVGASG